MGGAVSFWQRLKALVRGWPTSDPWMDDYYREDRKNGTARVVLKTEAHYDQEVAARKAREWRMKTKTGRVNRLGTLAILREEQERELAELSRMASGEARDRQSIF